MAVEMMPEAAPVNLPKPLVPSEKMVGNIMELKNPISSSDHCVTAPPPAAIASISKPTAIDALNAKYLLGAILFIKPAPIKRPTIAPPQ